MRWLCSLLGSVAAAAGAAGAAAQSSPAQQLQFDVAAIPTTRDSFVFLLRGEPRGFAVWQYEIRSVEMGQDIVFTARSEFRPAEEERLRVVLNRLTGAPVASFHHIDLFAPGSDTVMVEHDLDVKRGDVEGRRRVGRRNGDVQIIPVSKPLPAGAVWSSYVLYAAAVTNLAPGDSLTVPVYKEFQDTVVTVSLVAGQPTAVQVPAGRFEVLPIKNEDFVVYVTRAAPRRVVKGETADRAFSFQLARIGRVVPSQP